MNRRSVVAWLLGALGLARAQEAVYIGHMPTCEGIECATSAAVAVTSEQAAVTPLPNNVCPVCRTVAPTFYFGNDGKTVVAYWRGEQGPYIEPERSTVNLARCKNCNAAFWQDAERK